MLSIDQGHNKPGLTKVTKGYPSGQSLKGKPRNTKQQQPIKTQVNVPCWRAWIPALAGRGSKMTAAAVALLGGRGAFPVVLIEVVGRAQGALVPPWKKAPTPSHGQVWLCSWLLAGRIRLCHAPRAQTRMNTTQWGKSRLPNCTVSGIPLQLRPGPACRCFALYESAAIYCPRFVGLV